MKGFLALALCAPTLAFAQEVTLDTFVRAESDHMFRENMSAGAPIGAFGHGRKPTTAETQAVIRSNQDTLYSMTVLDLSEPAEITLPDIGGRYQSMHVINQDHYMFVEAEPGTYRLTKEEVGTPFALVIVRTFVDVNDPDDIAAAHAAQDALGISGGGDGPFVAPDWDLERLATLRQAFNDISTLGFDSTYAFGSESETRPIDHLVGAAAGWGGLPRSAAFYVIDSVAQNDGETPYTVTAKDVPVDGFWSVTVYNADGFLEANDLGRNSYNNVTAKPNDDGSITLNFGSCDDGRINCIPITPGWSYLIRMYEPRPEILDGSWTFPAIEPLA
jgi:hypothetical protein